MSQPDRSQIRQVLRKLCDERGPGKTFCPSEAARRLDPDGWRCLMKRVRDEAKALEAEGVLIWTQGGKPVEPDAAGGPIRLGAPL